MKVEEAKASVEDVSCCRIRARRRWLLVVPDARSVLDESPSLPQNATLSVKAKKATGA
jgi:hypothetical protein